MVQERDGNVVKSEVILLIVAGKRCYFPSA